MAAKKTYTPQDPPGDFVVFIHYRPGYEVSRMRIGSYATEADAREGIKTSKRMRRETYGGLMASAEKVGGPVRYSIWQATGWTHIGVID